MKNHNSFGRDMRQTFLGEVGGVGGGRGGANPRGRAGMLRNLGRARLLSCCNVIQDSL